MTPSANFSLIHLVREPLRKNPGAPPLLLLLHGVGSHENDLFALAPRLDERFFVVSARAPITLTPSAYAWFNVKLNPAGPTINAQDAEQSRQKLLAFIDELVAAYQLDPKQVYLMGFSQGAIMGLSVALTRPDKVAGVIVMSGRVLPEVLPLLATPDALKGLPILVVHGTEDQILPVQRFARPSRDILSKLPVALTYREYPMGHQVGEESLRDIAAWLKERLETKGQ